jgi:MarR family transcriptional regulator, organic hydroperoxide resistance regulator
MIPRPGGPAPAEVTADPTSSKRSAVISDAQGALSQLFRAERRLRARDQQRRERMTYAQSRALIALAEIGAVDTAVSAVSAGQLARTADLHPATVTAMLDLLEDQGLVVRRRSDVDRRSVLVALTPQGQAVLERKREEWRARWTEVLEEIDETDIETATRVMRRLAAIFSGL